MENSDNPGCYQANSEPAEYTPALEEENRDGMKGEKRRENCYLSKQKSQSHRRGMKALLNVLDE